MVFLELLRDAGGACAKAAILTYSGHRYTLLHLRHAQVNSIRAMTLNVYRRSLDRH
jgi:hypothetical protein